MTILGKQVSLAGLISFVIALAAGVPGLVTTLGDLIQGKPITSASLWLLLTGVLSFTATYWTHENTSSSGPVVPVVPVVPAAIAPLPPPPAA